MMNKLFASMVTAAVFGTAASLASAGFTAELGPVDVSGGPVLSTITPGVITNYTPDTSHDPQITGGDLNHFHVMFPALTYVAPVGVTPGSLTGTYIEYYDLGNDGFDAGDPRVSTGNVAFNVTTAAAADGSFNLDGSLIQTAGPTNPAFADITYGQPLNPLSFTGFYRPAIAVPEIDGIIVQGLSIPEPASFSLLALPALALYRRRSR